MSTGQQTPLPGDLVLSIGDQNISGWETIRVTCGVERVPSDFELALSEKFPGQAAAATVQPGQACVVKLGGQLVVTGYVDRFSPSLSAQQHEIRVSGRGKCQDLVDCSVTENEVPGLMVRSAPILSLATMMTSHFGITVKQLSGQNQILPTFNVNMAETPWDVLERVARYSQLLVYEGPDGNLLLAQVGTTSMASGFIEGVNVEDAAASFGMDERFSVYIPSLMSVDKLTEFGGAGNNFPRIYDTTVPRYRPRVIVSEQFQGTQSIAVARANWERSRRFGRAQMIRLTCDSWTDIKGTPWTPNTLAVVNMPSLKVTNATWVISEVSYMRDADRGTTAEVTLMPKEAFQPEPELLQAIDWQVGQDLAASSGGRIGPI